MNAVETAQRDFTEVNSRRAKNRRNGSDEADARPMPTLTPAPTERQMIKCLID